MSLINDALKRAQQAQDKQAQDKQAQDRLTPNQIHSQPARAPMQVAPAAPPSRLWPLALVCLLLAVTLSAGGIWYLHKKPGLLHSAASMIIIRPATQTAAEEPHSTYEVKPLPPYVPPSTEPEPDGVQTLSSPASPAIPLPVADAAPNVQLQGILYRPDKPEAIIDGRTVFVGDHLSDGNGEGVVTAITPSSVTLRWEGKSFVLHL